MNYSFCGLILSSHYLPIFLWSIPFFNKQFKLTLEALEFPINFENFGRSKSIDNVLARIKQSFVHCKIQNSDLNWLSADGMANAVGIISEYESLACTMRPNGVDFTVCLTHQNESSSGFASGTIEFTQPKNANLWALT